MDNTVEISFSNISVIDLPKEELQKEYEILKKGLTLAQAELENKNQELYNVKRELTVAKQLENDYKQEIENIHIEAKTENENLARTVAALEIEKKDSKVKHLEEMLVKELELEKKDEEIRKLKIELSFLTDTCKNTNGNTKDFEKMHEENFTLKEMLNDLEEQIGDLQEENGKLNEKNVDLDGIVQSLQNDYVSIKENYVAKKDEVIDKVQLIEQLQEELMVLRNEMDQLKAQPMDPATRGNSLFAEVDDRRIELIQDMQTMRTKYKEMKNERASLLKKIEHLRQDNARLLQKCKHEIDEQQRDDQELLRVHNSRIRVLEELIESYQKELKNNPIKYSGQNLCSDEIKFVEDTLASKSKEMEELRKLISNNARREITLTAELRSAHRELGRLKSESAELKLEIESLKQVISDLKENGIKLEQTKEPTSKKPAFDTLGSGCKPQPLKTTNVASSIVEMEVDVNKILKHCKDPKETTKCKENIECNENIESKSEDKGKRKVAFAEGTKEETDKVTTRKGRRIVYIQPMKL